MHVDNQIRDGHITIFVKKSKKGEILINWRTLKKNFKNLKQIILKILKIMQLSGDLASLYQK